MIIVGEKGIYQICVNDYPMAIQLDQTIDMAHRDKMKEDLGTLMASHSREGGPRVVFFGKNVEHLQSLKRWAVSLPALSPKTLM